LAVAQEKWQEVVTDAFKRNLETLKIHYQSYKGLREITLYSFLTVLPEQQYIEIVMQVHIVTLSNLYGMKLYLIECTGDSQIGRGIRNI
jgi:hypothetical protein